MQTKSCSLEVQNLHQRLGKQKDLTIESLSLSQGKRVALLGLNGAGKSSLIRLLTGQTSPDSGKISFNKINPKEIKLKQTIGYQADSMQSIAGQTCLAYLKFCGYLKGLTSLELSGQIDLLCDDWAIDELLPLYMSTLSKGNLQKLAIAQVFIGKSKYLFFDEPCQNLDPVEQERFKTNIKNLSKFELCIFSTHNVEQALQIADEILLIHQAKIIYHFKTGHRKERKWAAGTTDLSNDSCENHLLLLAKPSSEIDVILQKLNFEFKRVNRLMYQLFSPNKIQLESLRQVVDSRQIETRFCEKEEEAIMPLFKQLASGEINFSKDGVP